MAIELSSHARGPLTLIQVEGDLNESSQLDRLLKAVRGKHAVLDLGGVLRVSSYGVREWVRTMAGASDMCLSLVWINCSYAIGRQLAMIDGFSGNAHVASIQTPYCCPDCDLEEAIEHDLRAGNQPMRKDDCSSCGATLEMDEDEEAYFNFVETLVPITTLPAPVLAALNMLLAERGASTAGVVELTEAASSEVPVRQAPAAQASYEFSATDVLSDQGSFEDTQNARDLFSLGAPVHGDGGGRSDTLPEDLKNLNTNEFSLVEFEEYEEKVDSFAPNEEPTVQAPAKAIRPAAASADSASAAGRRNRRTLDDTVSSASEVTTSTIPTTGHRPSGPTQPVSGTGNQLLRGIWVGIAIGFIAGLAVGILIG